MGAGSIPVAILPLCQDVKAFALLLHDHEYRWVVETRNISEAVSIMSLGQYNSLGEYCGPHTASCVFLILLYTSYSGTDHWAVINVLRVFQNVPKQSNLCLI